jgi:hypothetical protein
MKRVPFAVVVIALLPITATSAQAASTRAEYVAQVDQTCGTSAPAFKKTFKTILNLANKMPLPPDGVDPKRFLRKLNRWGKQLARAQRRFDRVFAAMVEKIAAVPPAPGDEGAAGQWVSGLRQYVDLSARGSRAAKHGKIFQALSFLDKAATALDTGGVAVQGFGISRCPTSADSALF